jgi:hypothetical protein
MFGHTKSTFALYSSKLKVEYYTSVKYVSYFFFYIYIYLDIDIDIHVHVLPACTPAVLMEKLFEP